MTKQSGKSSDFKLKVHYTQKIEQQELKGGEHSKNFSLRLKNAKFIGEQDLEEVNNFHPSTDRGIKNDN